MPVQTEIWTSELAASALAGSARAIPLAAPHKGPELAPETGLQIGPDSELPPRHLGVVPAPPRPELPPRRPVSATHQARAIRLLDIVGASAALFLLSPLLLMVAAAIKLLDPGPLLFAHVRVGKGGQPFRCLKFRSMTVDADARLARLLETDPAARAEWAATHKLRDDPRITPLGRFLRRTCLDELPQFFNVLRGEMSLVGPRPIVAAEAARYGRHYPVYCSLKPGITGLWQVKREDQTSYRRRIAFDLTYARSRSLSLNLGILLLTVPSVVRGQGAC
jgi:lipopolysaccharide/colanic/teichoic acid biosynthesis glycosyltransferase